MGTGTWGMQGRKRGLTGLTLMRLCAHCAHVLLTPNVSIITGFGAVMSYNYSKSDKNLEIWSNYTCIFQKKCCNGGTVLLL